MVSRTITVAEISGVHLRPAGRISEVSLRYRSKVQIKKGDHTANAKSVLGLLAARIGQGDTIEIICAGEDEEDALEAVLAEVKGC